MHRLARRLFTLCSAASLVLCAAVCVLWVRSFWVWDRPQLSHLRLDEEDVGDGYVIDTGGRWMLAHGSSVNGGLGIELWLVRFGGSYSEKYYERSRGQDGFAFEYESTESSPGAYPFSGQGRLGFYFARKQNLHGDRSDHWHRHERSWRFVAPAWACLLIAAVLPVISLRAAVRGRRSGARRAAGRCAKCGYDLRATPGRCPECGAEPAAAA